MKLAGENQSAQRITYPSTTLFTKNSTWTGLGLKWGWQQLPQLLLYQK
jgi:hypothetical protein